GEPSCTCPVLGPRWVTSQQTMTLLGVLPSRLRSPSAPTIRVSRLDSTAYALTVYASPTPLPTAAQHSLPAAGQALPDGILTRRAPLLRFKVASVPPVPEDQAWPGAHVKRDT